MRRLALNLSEKATTYFLNASYISGRHFKIVSFQQQNVKNGKKHFFERAHLGPYDRFHSML